MINLSTKKHKARKEHRCQLCSSKIKIGQVYESQANVYDGDFYIWKSHLDCVKLATELNMWDYADEGLNEEIYDECVQEQYCVLFDKGVITHSDGSEWNDVDWYVMHEKLLSYYLGTKKLMEKL